MRFMTELDERLDAHSYPTTTEELVSAHGEVEIDLPDGTETVRDTFERIGPTTFETAEAARLTAYSAVGDDAIGRKHYSDRDPSAIGEDGHDQISF